MILKKIMISKFIKQIPDCKELHQGEIILDYLNRKIISKAHYTNTGNCDVNITDSREMDTQSEAFFEALIRKGKEWSEIHFIRIILLPKDIEIYLMGIKDGKQQGEKAPL